MYVNDDVLNEFALYLSVLTGIEKKITYCLFIVYNTTLRVPIQGTAEPSNEF